MANSVTGAIPFSRYVNITSGVQGADVVTQRLLIGRIFTDNPLVPPQSFVQFTGGPSAALAAVASYFGSTSNEYLRAAFYFAWVSKSTVAPQAISFARWVDTIVGAQIHGAVANYSLTALNLITAGSFTLTFAGFTFTLSAINLSGAGSLTAVAALLQTAIRAQSGGGTAWTTATVVYNTTRGSFDFTSGATGADTLTVVDVSGIAASLGWLLSSGAILCNGSAVETLTQTLNTSIGLSNNFGSFLFMTSALTLANFTEIATWSAAQNNMYLFCAAVTSANAAATSSAILALEGTAMTLAPITTEYPEMIPMIVLAATDYTKPNAVQNFMYQVNFNVTPSVVDPISANTYDAERVNYYGQTQYAGNYVAFYQRGYMTGGTTAPTDINTYCNEMWLKNAAAAALLNLLLQTTQVSANLGGISLIHGQLMTVIQSALLNGVISKGKTLTTAQKAAITNASNDPNAYQQVASIGYWLGIAITSAINGQSGLTEYTCTYTLIYAQNNAVRTVVGTHVLI